MSWWGLQIGDPGFGSVYDTSLVIGEQRIPCPTSPRLFWIHSESPRPHHLVCDIWSFQLCSRVIHYCVYRKKPCHLSSCRLCWHPWSPVWQNLFPRTSASAQWVRWQWLHLFLWKLQGFRLGKVLLSLTAGVWRLSGFLPALEGHHEM